jgi:hypothetical protein
VANIQQFPNKTNSTDNFSGAPLSSWSRQQKIAMIAGCVILGFLIAMSACSKQASKPALSISSPAVSSPVPAATPATAASSTTPNTAAPVAKKKSPKKRPAAIVTYSDPDSGVSFRYPRKYDLAAGEKAQPEIAGLGPVPMNFVQPGGVAVATVVLPRRSYPGTDFTTAFFNVNVNRSLSEQECSQFAFVDTRNPDGEAVDPEKVEVGSIQLDKNTDFSADAIKQAEAQYYHRYENGACYEFVLGLGTAGYGTREGIEPVNHDEVFAKLEKILATVKIQPVEVEKEQVAATTAPFEAAK